MQFYQVRVVGVNPHQNASYVNNSYCALRISALLNVNEVKGETKSH